jgi:hypothetical protein
MDATLDDKSEGGDAVPERETWGNSLMSDQCTPGTSEWSSVRMPRWALVCVD